MHFSTPKIRTRSRFALPAALTLLFGSTSPITPSSHSELAPPSISNLGSWSSLLVNPSTPSFNTLPVTGSARLEILAPLPSNSPVPGDREALSAITSSSGKGAVEPTASAPAYDVIAVGPKVGNPPARGGPTAQIEAAPAPRPPSPTSVPVLPRPQPNSIAPTPAPALPLPSATSSLSPVPSVQPVLPGGPGTAAGATSWGVPAEVHRVEAGVARWITALADIDGSTPGADLLTVDDQITTLHGPPPSLRKTPGAAAPTATTVAVWAPQAVTGRWEMRVRVQPGTDPAAVVAMDLIPVGELGEQVRGLGEGPHLGSRMVEQVSATNGAPTWRHWAIERTASATRLFLDGSLLQEVPLGPASATGERPVQLRLWVQSSPTADSVPSRAELEWVAFYPAGNS